MKPGIPGMLATAGGILVFASGALSLALGLGTGSLWYEPDPNGIFGHIGILAGVAAMAIGALILWLARRQYRRRSHSIIAGITTAVLGHLGAITGALLVGTAGMVLCYAAGIWLIVVGARSSRVD